MSISVKKYCQKIRNRDPPPNPPLELYGQCTLGKSPQGTKEHFEVCFTASFKGKTVQCTMNELYRSGATREAA